MKSNRFRLFLRIFTAKHLDRSENGENLRRSDIIRAPPNADSPPRNAFSRNTPPPYHAFNRSANRPFFENFKKI